MLFVFLVFICYCDVNGESETEDISNKDSGKYSSKDFLIAARSSGSQNSSHRYSTVRTFCSSDRLLQYDDGADDLVRDRDQGLLQDTGRSDHFTDSTGVRAMDTGRVIDRDRDRDRKIDREIDREIGRDRDKRIRRGGFVRRGKRCAMGVHIQVRVRVKANIR